MIHINIINGLLCSLEMITANIDTVHEKYVQKSSFTYSH